MEAAMTDPVNLRLERAKRNDDNREWTMRDMCEYIIHEIDNGDKDLENASRAVLIYETEQDKEGASNIWHLAMKANFSDRLELIEWHKFFLFEDWRA